MIIADTGFLNKRFELSTENIIPVITSEFGQAARRPLKAGMKCDRLYQTLNWKLQGTSEGLSFLKTTSLF